MLYLFLKRNVLTMPEISLELAPTYIAKQCPLKAWEVELGLLISTISTAGWTFLSEFSANSRGSNNLRPQLGEGNRSFSQFYPLKYTTCNHKVFFFPIQKVVKLDSYSELSLPYFGFSLYRDRAHNGGFLPRLVSQLLSHIPVCIWVASS